MITLIEYHCNKDQTTTTYHRCTFVRGVCYIVIVSEKASKVSGKIRHNIRDLSEDVHCLGDNTEVKVVMVDDSDQRDWLAAACICPLLAQHQIAHTGIMSAESGLEVIRTDQSGSYFMACIDGEGEVLFNGGWRKLRPGHACFVTTLCAKCASFRARKVMELCVGAVCGIEGRGSDRNFSISSSG